MGILRGNPDIFAGAGQAATERGVPADAQLLHIFGEYKTLRPT